MPRSSSAVAGAGTITRPCAVRACPVPTTGGAEPIDAGASQAIAAAAPTTSAIESNAPTSWNVTAIDRRAVQRRLDVGDAREDVRGERAHVAIERRAPQQAPDLGVVAVLVPPVPVDVIVPVIV